MNWICQSCEKEIEPEEEVWIDPKTEKADQRNGEPYHVGCAPTQYEVLTPRLLASVIYKILDLHEETFNDEAFNLAYYVYRQKNPDGWFGPNPENFYEYSMDYCINFYLDKYNIDPRFFRIIDLCFHWQGDSYEWAKSTLSRESDF